MSLTPLMSFSPNRRLNLAFRQRPLLAARRWTVQKSAARAHACPADTTASAAHICAATPLPSARKPEPRMNDSAVSAAANTLQDRLRGRPFRHDRRGRPAGVVRRRRICCARRPRSRGSPTPSTSPTARARARIWARVAAAAILIGAGIEPILQLTCRDRNRLALQSDLMGAAALGVRNLLLLTGDDPKAGDQPDTKPVFDIDSKTLIDTARRAARRRAIADRPKGRGQGRVLPRRRRHADRSEARLAAAPRSPARSRPARSSRRRSSAWMPAIVRRYVGRLAEAGLTQTARHPHRHQAAEIRRLGAMDAQAPVRHHHPRRDDRADGRRRRPGARRPAHLRRIDRGAFDAFPASPACTSWRRAMTRRCRR